MQNILVMRKEEQIRAEIGGNKTGISEDIGLALVKWTTVCMGET